MGKGVSAMNQQQKPRENAGSSANTADQNELGDIGSAPASGEPAETGRSRGQVIDASGRAAGKIPDWEDHGKKPAHNDNTSGKSGRIDQAPESGRQRATP
jgi:hypothetical protein